MNHNKLYARFSWLWWSAVFQLALPLKRMSTEVVFVTWIVLSDVGSCTNWADGPGQQSPRRQKGGYSSTTVG